MGRGVEKGHDVGSQSQPHTLFIKFGGGGGGRGRWGWGGGGVKRGGMRRKRHHTRSKIINRLSAEH
jgi:hypothetical protein